MATLNHIGIAIQDLPGMTKLFSLLELEVSHREPVPEQGVITHFLPLPVSETSLELLEVSDPKGTVARYLEKKGPGIHHLSFCVKKGELDELCKKLTQNGYKLVYPSPKMGAHEMKVNFIHPASAGGILIEVMEPA